MFYQTEAKPQCWRAVAVFDDRSDRLLYLGRGPAERARLERAARETDERERSSQRADAAGGPASSWYSGHSPPQQPEHDPDEEDWVPPPLGEPRAPWS